MRKIFIGLSVCMLFLCSACGSSEERILGTYRGENEMEVEFKDNGEMVTTFAGTYRVDMDEGTLSLGNADSSGTVDYQIVQQGGLLELQQNGQPVISLKHQSGEDGLTEDLSEAFEGSYCYAEDEGNVYQFHKDGTLDMINTQSYTLMDSDRIELRGSEGSVIYQLEQTEEGLRFKTETGELVLELMRS